MVGMNERENLGIKSSPAVLHEESRPGLQLSPAVLGEGRRVAVLEGFKLFPTGSLHSETWPGRVAISSTNICQAQAFLSSVGRVFSTVVAASAVAVKAALNAACGGEDQPLLQRELWWVFPRVKQCLV